MAHFDKALFMDGRTREWRFEFAKALHHEIGDKVAYVVNTRNWWVYSSELASWALVGPSCSFIFQYIGNKLRPHALNRLIELESQGYDRRKVIQARHRIADLDKYISLKQVVQFSTQIFIKPDFKLDGFDKPFLALL